jgi:hypothetical protein
MVTDLPQFWRGRISELILADNLPQLSRTPLFDGTALIRNPYAEAYFGEFYVRSACRLMQRHGLQFSVAHVSFFRKILDHEQSLSLEFSTGAVGVVFVESGLLQQEQNHPAGEVLLVNESKPASWQAKGRTTLVVVRFD